MSTDVLNRPVAAPPMPPTRKKRRRRRFSLNGLAIQLSAFALSFTLVALLVVTGSQAAFVEENQTVTDYVPIGTAAGPSDDGVRGRPSRPRSPDPTPTSPAPAIAEMPDTVVDLADSDAGTAMFGQETTLAPGVTSDRCIEVAFDGNVDPSPVQLYAAVTTGELAPYLDLTVELGESAAGSFGDCATFVATDTLYSGTLADFAAAHSSWFTGLPTWDPRADVETRTFRFVVSVQDVPVAEGKSVVFGFAWEARGDA